MAKIKVIAGNIDKGKYEFMITDMTKTFGSKVQLSNNIDRIETLTEQDVKKLAGTAGWGLAGAALLGPLGAIGGMLIGGKKKEVCFACYLKDGQKFMAITTQKIYQQLVGMSF